MEVEAKVRRELIVKKFETQVAASMAAATAAALATLPVVPTGAQA